MTGDMLTKCIYKQLQSRGEIVVYDVSYYKIIYFEKININLTYLISNRN